MIRLRSILLIFILYYTGQYSRAILGANCDSTALLKDGRSDSFAIDTDGKDSELVTRTERKSEDINPQTDSDKLTDEERSARCLLGSRRYLKKHDANQVAEYFVGNARCNTNDDDKSNVVGASNPTNENYMQQPINGNYFNTEISDPVVGVPHIPVSYAIPASVPLVSTPYTNAYRPITRGSNFVSRPLSGLFHRHLHHPLGAGLHPLLGVGVPLLRAASAPLHGLLHPQVLRAMNPLYSSLRQNENIVGSSNALLPKSTSEKSDTLDSECSNGNNSPKSNDPQIGASNTANEGRSENRDSEQKIPTQEVYPTNSRPILTEPYLFNYPEPTGYIVSLVPSNGVLSGGLPWKEGPQESLVGAPKIDTEQKSEGCSVDSKDKDTK